MEQIGAVERIEKVVRRKFIDVIVSGVAFSFLWFLILGIVVVVGDDGCACIRVESKGAVDCRSGLQLLRCCYISMCIEISTYVSSEFDR